MKLRSEEEVLAKFRELVDVRDSLTEGSAARRDINGRVRVLGWALNHPEATDPRPPDKILDLLDCLS